MGDIYLDLIKTGNVLFKNWNATIFCDKNNINTMKVNFGLSNNSQNIIAMKKFEKIAINSINKTVKFLKDCHSEWLNHVNEKYQEFNELNFFRIDQIVCLRKEMSAFINNVNKNANHQQLFDLLYNINKSLNKKLLSDANKNALDKMYELTQKETSTNPQQEIEENNQKIIQELLDLDFSKKTILKGIKTLKTTEKDQLIDYCVQNDFDNDSNESENELNPSHSNRILNFEHELKEEILIGHRDPYDEDNDQLLETKYKNIWQKFLVYLDCNFDDFVCLKHLGLVLKYLKSKSEILIQRTKPVFLETNLPNLIICPQDEILKRTLSIYSLSHDQPLPTDDEILFCNSATSHEQIDLFFKRTLNSANEHQNSKKIFCLINVQDLLYDQAVKAQVTFEKMLSNRESNFDDLKHKDFVLCIICSAEKEDKSVFVTAFNRYRKNIPFDKNSDKDLRIYLASHLQCASYSDSLSLKSIEKNNLNMRIVTSDRGGVGKSLYIRRTIERAKIEIDSNIDYCCISIKKQTLPFEEVFRSLKKFEQSHTRKLPKIFHIDIAYEVWYEVDYFLFNLFCLGVLQNANGQIFRRDPRDLYLIEIMAPKLSVKNDQETNVKFLHSCLSIFPSLICLTPIETLDLIKEAKEIPDHICPILFDDINLKSDLIQRPCQYLQAMDVLKNFDKFKYTPDKFLNAKVCLELLIKHLENKSPSWSEIVNFSKFLNVQLIDSENSVFCSDLLCDDLPGFKTFVVNFMIQMSHDFALPSLYISDRSALQMNSGNKAQFEIEQLSLRRKWENDPHPYLFFNPGILYLRKFSFTLKFKIFRLFFKFNKKKTKMDKRKTNKFLYCKFF
jgi:E3 ubiquitin-protein ligase RNF213